MKIMSTNIHLVGISGSLRKASYNTALFRAAQELLPEVKKTMKRRCYEG